MPTNTTMVPSSVMVAALARLSSGRRRLNAPNLRLEKMMRTSCISTKKVVVLMPPPVDPGDAPMNIKIIITSSPALVMAPISMVEKPAVRVVMLWNSAAKKLIGSVSQSSIAPPKISTAVVESTTLLCSVSLRNRPRQRSTSSITIKPMPPKTIIPSVTRFSQRLLQ